MKPIHLLVKVTKNNNKNISAEGKIQIHKDFLKSNNYSCWGSNHNLKEDTINCMIDENRNMKLKTYILFLFSSKERTTDDNFEYMAELLGAIRGESINKNMLPNIPPLFRDNEHKLWLKIRNIKKVSTNNDYLLNKYRTLRNINVKKINMCSMVRIKKIK